MLNPADITGSIEECGLSVYAYAHADDLQVYSDVDPTQ